MNFCGKNKIGGDNKMINYQIQHLYHINSGGFATYHHTETVKVDTDIDDREVVHIIVNPLPAKVEVTIDTH